MRIGMFTDTWLPAMDGVVNTIVQFRKSLEKNGHEVFIFAPGEEDCIDPDDDHVFRFKSKRFTLYPDYRMAFYPSNRTHGLILEKNIDVIHNHAIAFMSVKAMIASKMLEVPCVFNFHTWVTDALHYYPVNLNESLLKRLSWIYLTYLLNRSDAVIAPSNQTLRHLKKRCPDIAYSEALAPGIDLHRYNPDVDGSEIRDELDLGDSEVIIHVGRISKEKNIDLVLDSLPLLKKHHPDVKMLIVGDGPAKDYYSDRVRKKGLRNTVLFTGFVPEKELPKYYACADAFVISSPFETLGIVILEALATGTVVAGLDHGVIPDIIKEGENGYLFHENVKSCAAKISQALNNKEIVKENGRPEEFDNDLVGGDLVELYKKARKIKWKKIGKS